MDSVEITDPLFRRAVEAIDAGDLVTLSQLLDGHPGLIRQRLSVPVTGYFSHPFLLWFIAGNPVRAERLPANIVGITDLLIKAARRHDSFRQQLDYTLGLVATGRVPRESGVQTELIDLLIDAGAAPASGIGALANGNVAAAEQLIRRGGEMTLAAAAGLGLADEVARLAPGAGKDERELAVVVAAFYGRADLLSQLIGPDDTLIGLDIDLNSYPKEGSGFHGHATALHQAVSSGSLEAVKFLVEAGASTRLTDRIYGGTPFDWAEHLSREPGEEGIAAAGDEGDAKKEKYKKIAEYLSTHL
jgi:hypothetical protein